VSVSDRASLSDPNPLWTLIFRPASAQGEVEIGRNDFFPCGSHFQQLGGKRPPVTFLFGEVHGHSRGGGFEASTSLRELPAGLHFSPAAVESLVTLFLDGL